VVFEAFKKFSTGPERFDDARLLIDQEFTKFELKIGRCVRADAILASNHVGVLVRSKFKKLIRPGGRRNAPGFSLKDARELIKETKLRVRPQRIFGKAILTSPADDCCGHVLEQFGYHLLVHALSKFCNYRLTPRELLLPGAIDAFATSLTNDSPLVAHYTKHFAATFDN
jgi:hypothetical protein